MKSILNILLLFLLFVSCKTRQLHIEKNENRQKEVQKIKKDSVFDQKKEVKTTTFEWNNSQSLEIEFESDTLKGKSLIFERIRRPAGEKIIVQGGKARLKIGSTNRQFQSQTDTILKNKGTIGTNKYIHQTTDKQVFNKSKQVEVKGFSFWSSFWILLLVIGMFIAWRLKIFRWFK